MKRKNRFIHWLKTSKMKGFNLFYSPSYDIIWRAGSAFANGIRHGVESDKPFTGLSPETWEILQRSAEAITWGDEDQLDK